MKKKRSRALIYVLFLVAIALGTSHCGRPAPTAVALSTRFVPPTATPSPTEQAASPTVLPSLPTTGFPTQQPAATHTPTATVTQTQTASPQPTPTATPTPTPVPLNTATPAPAGEPVIHYFRANVDTANPGDTIVLQWESSGATGATLSPISASGQMPATGVNVAASGTYSYDIPIDARNVSRFYLSVYDNDGHSAGVDLAIPLRCPVAWFFQPEPIVCGSDPIHSSAAEQHFERGTMVWVAAEDAIVVLYDDDRASPKWERFTDEWDEGEPDHDRAIVAPEGMLQPVRGFGLIWREQGRVRERLGWALDQETAFDSIMQFTTLYKYNSIYLKALDGNVWHLGPERSSWAKLVVTEP